MTGRQLLCDPLPFWVERASPTSICFFNKASDIIFFTKKLLKSPVGNLSQVMITT